MQTQVVKRMPKIPRVEHNYIISLYYIIIILEKENENEKEITKNENEKERGLVSNLGRIGGMGQKV